MLDALRCPGCGRNLGVRGVAQRGPVGQHHQRELRVLACHCQQLAALVGIGQAERVRDSAALEHGPKLVGPPRPVLANDVHGLGDEPPLTRPFQQKAGDRFVEHLIRRLARLAHEVVDATDRHRPADQIGPLGTGQCTGRYEQRTFRVWVKPACHIERVPARRVEQRLSDEDESEVGAELDELVEPLHRAGHALRRSIR